MSSGKAPGSHVRSIHFRAGAEQRLDAGQVAVDSGGHERRLPVGLQTPTQHKEDGRLGAASAA
jgi:hypothetical protein